MMPRQRCTRRLCLCVAVAVVSVVFGAAVGVYFGFRILEAETTKVKEFRGAFRVVSGDNYTEELMDVFSDEFLSRSRMYKARLDGIFSNSVLKKAYFGSEILAIDPGEMTSGEDVVVRFNIRMDPSKIDVDAGDVYLVLVNEILRGQTRLMTELSIDQDSIEVHERKSFTPPSRAPPLLHSTVLLKSNSDASRLITFLNEQDRGPPAPTASTDHARIDSLPMPSTSGATRLTDDDDVDVLFDAKSNILEAILASGNVVRSPSQSGIRQLDQYEREYDRPGSSRQRITSSGRRPEIPFGSRRTQQQELPVHRDRDANLISLSSQNRVSQTTPTPMGEKTSGRDRIVTSGRDRIVTSDRGRTTSGRDYAASGREPISSEGKLDTIFRQEQVGSIRDDDNLSRPTTNSDTRHLKTNPVRVDKNSELQNGDHISGSDSFDAFKDGGESERSRQSSTSSRKEVDRRPMEPDRLTIDSSRESIDSSGDSGSRSTSSDRESFESDRKSTASGSEWFPSSVSAGPTRSAQTIPTASSPAQQETEVHSVNVVPHTSDQLEGEVQDTLNDPTVNVQQVKPSRKTSTFNGRHKLQSSSGVVPSDGVHPVRVKDHLASPPRILSITNLGRDRSSQAIRTTEAGRTTAALEELMAPPTAASEGSRDILSTPPRTASKPATRRQPGGINRGKITKPISSQSQQRKTTSAKHQPTTGDDRHRKTTPNRQPMTSPQTSKATVRVQPTAMSPAVKMATNNVSSIAAKLIPLLPLLTKSRQCVPPQLNMCANLTEDFTKVPTLSSILDKEKIGPVFDFIRNVLESGCFEYAHFFVCQFLQPGCENGRPVLPCRSFCESFLDKCSHLLPDEIYHLLTCRILPEEKTTKCVATPECVHDLRSKGQNYLVCDGIVDCYDMSDETRCGWCKPGQFVCGGRKCVNLTSRCDGKSDCPNGADERNCLALAGGAAEAAHAHPYTSEGYVFLNDKGAMGKICADTLLKSVAKDRREVVLKNVGESACDLLHYKKMDFVDTREDIDGVGPYFHILNPLSWRVTFLEAPCKSKQVVYAGCKDFACGKRPSHTPVSTMRYLERNKLSALVDHGDWPWHAALFNEEEHACDATLIDQQWLLTSAACFQGHGSGQWWAVIGGVRQDSEAPFQQRRRLIGRSPSPIKGSDVVLLKLDSAVTLTDFVRPACLPRSDSMFRTGKQCITLGWDLPRGHLRQVSIILTETEECLWRWPVGKLHVFCTTEPTSLVNDCQGEDQAGGPLLCDDNGTWYLVGVVNWRIGCGLSKQPRLYDSVGVNTNWILSTIRNHQQEPAISQEIVDM